jgi:AcrR family transcriptional regulator
MADQQLPRRADGRRNRERILTAAAAVIARDGAGASLEEIARRAGVGSATLHRHFRSRAVLLNEVFRDGMEQFRRRAREVDLDGEPGALLAWLGELAAYAASHRGVVESLRATEDLTEQECCHHIISGAAHGLVNQAVDAGALRPDVTVDDLLALVNGVSVAAEGDPRQAVRLVDLAFTGLRPPGRQAQESAPGQ